MAAKPKSQVANDKTPFWTYPRTSLDDGICYYIRDQRKTKHADIEILEDHPLAKSDPAFENMVFVSREPADREGILVKDWYVPKTLVDDLLSVSKTGSGARSSLLYPIGTEAPEGDSRIGLLGHCRGEMVFTVAYVNYPSLSLEPAGTSNPSNLLSLTRSSGVAEFTEDEIYIDLTSLQETHATPTSIKKYVDGVVTEEFKAGVHKIVRHLKDESGDPTIIHLEVPANDGEIGGGSSAGPWTGRSYTAKYILEGTTDSEDAPGILRGKFLVRNFNYRIGDPGITSQRDDTIGVKVVTERRVVPETWSYNWDVGYTTASTADCTSSLGFAPASELVTQQTKQYISGTPDTLAADIVSYGIETVSIPKIVKAGDLLWAWALAEKNGYLAYDDDIGLEITTGGGGGVKCPSKTTRKIIAVEEGDQAGITTAINAMGFGGHLYNPSATTYTIAFQSYVYYAGKNVWAKARVRTWSITNALVLDNVQINIKSDQGEPVLAGASPQALTLSARTEDTSVWVDDWKPYNIRIQRAKWCYWVIDFIEVKYPTAASFYT